MPQKPHILYLCYFGVREPLVQTQVLPYLREIVRDEIRVSLLTFEPNFQEKWSAEEIAAQKQKLAGAKIEWHCLPYHKSPTVPATLYDVFAGARFARRMIEKENVGALHARAHIPVLMALTAKIFKSCKIVFDVRGLIAEEYVDAGIWRENSAIFRFIKKVERLGLKRADQIVVLTRKMKNYLLERNLKTADRITVIPCCVDFSRQSNNEAKKNERFELIYAGSVVGLYLLEEMGKFFLELKKREPNAFFRVLTADPETVSRTFAELGVAVDDFAATFVEPSKVLAQVEKTRLAVSFRKPTFSQIAASPTKIPEYLAAGVPVVTNAGIGDMDEIIGKENVGVVINDFDAATLTAAVTAALELLEDEKIADRCVSAARRNFDLTTVGGAAYRQLYQRIFNRADA